MRVLWVCNIMLPMIAEKLHIESNVKEGWITGILSRILQDTDSKDLSLAIAFPVEENMKNFHDVHLLKGRTLELFGFFEDAQKPEQYQKGMEDRFQTICRSFQPDIMHIFGTEYGHSYAAAKAFGKPLRTLVGIQGIISVYADHYMDGVPLKEQKKRSFRDIIKRDSMKEQADKFNQRGRFELATVKLTGNVTGRTKFDFDFCQNVNPNATYYSMNETMRPCFYEGEWDYESCIKHQVFVSQGDYPLKGLHILLQAMPEILKIYPDAIIRVAGNDIIHKKGALAFLKISAYGKYLKRLIKDNSLENHIKFLGRLSAEEMKEEYLNCHTTVCPSILENSPNSVAEAMLIGTPVVAARVGGIPSMITDGEEGLLFEQQNSEDLVRTIIKLWEDDSKFPILRMTKAAKRRARTAHDPNLNYQRLIEIYHDIVKK